MQVIYALEEIPKSFSKSLFLAGPSCRQDTPPEYNWRSKALEVLEQLGYDGVVFVPLPRDSKWHRDYDGQVSWEQKAMNCSDVIVFWVPRDLKHLPGFTTNVEFGQRMALGNVVLGYPEEAEKMSYLHWMANHYHIKTYHTLTSTLDAAVRKIGAGVKRFNGECQIPIHLWKTSQFQNWYYPHTRAGNHIEQTQVLFDYRVKQEQISFFQGILVTMWIEAEQRLANPEIVFMRPDISTIIAYHRYKCPMQTEILLIKEFRPPSSNQEAMIYEAPGGSAFSEKNARLVALNELYEEAGLYIESGRLKEVGSRQLAATALSHKAHVYSVELTKEEIDLCKEQQASKVAFGVKEENEKTYIQVLTLDQILKQELLDWSNLGMIFSALQK